MLYKNVWVFLLLLGFVVFLAKLVTTEYEIDSKKLHFITWKEIVVTKNLKLKLVTLSIYLSGN